ncbi:MAG: hypothetical protein QOE70_6683 [Chthoniobacter sp.]|jgi:two-component system response regulator RegX3|nr:hypothetical protein [Chthoniobacter sp.]
MIILLVEDEPDIGFLMQSVLETEGHCVTLVGDGPEALAFFANTGDPVDLVISDLCLPTFGALELFEGMKRIGTPPKILVCSGGIDGKAEGPLRKAGITNFLAKPFRFPALISTVEAILFEAAGEPSACLGR